MRIYNLKRKNIPKLAVPATGLVAAVMVAALAPSSAQAFPSRQSDCTACHGAGVVSGTVTATASTINPAAGAAYTVAITMPANSLGGDTGYWIANSDAAGTTGPSSGVYGGATGTSASAYTAAMTAPSAAGTYYYKVWGQHGSTADGVANFALYSITVAGTPTTTPPPTTTTTPPPTTTTTPPPTTTTTPPPTTTTTTPPVVTYGIIGLAPNHGAIGSAVTINGSGFGTALGGVQFGTVSVSMIQSWTDTAITVTVPDGAGRVPVTVTPSEGTNAGLVSNGVNFRFARIARVK